jgi:BirA family biotin operon repressor/biotin-[acetyl-CoA-carboxylase] ligase
MKPLAIANPFPGASSFHVGTTSSTMDEARRLARAGFRPGSVIVADEQSAGRGRFADRAWRAPPGEGLLATLVLGPEAALIPALPLRIGLALCRTIDGLAGRPGKPAAALKWPNDVLLGGRKVAGILCEASPEGTFIGFGINVGMESFPTELADKATSLALALGRKTAELDRFHILELALGQIGLVLEDARWREEAEAVLWMKGKRVRFLSGLPESRNVVEGVLEGLDPTGALLIDPGKPSGPAAFAAGELIVEWPASAAPSARVDRNGSDHIM